MYHFLLGHRSCFCSGLPSLCAANPRGLGQERLPCIKKHQFPCFISWLSKRRGKMLVGLSRRFSLIVLQVSLDSDFQFTPVVFKIQMCEYFILFISLDSPKNFGLSWIILSHYVMRSISFSQQNEKLSQKTGNKLIQNA